MIIYLHLICSTSYAYYMLCIVLYKSDISGQILVVHYLGLRPFGDDFPKINQDSSGERSAWQMMVGQVAGLLVPSMTGNGQHTTYGELGVND